MSSQESSKKCKLTADKEKDEHVANEITRSKFWFDDGSIILRVEDTHFRPQQSDINVYIEGCPVITLADKVGDIEHLVSIFYDNIRAHDLRYSISIDHLGAILRLGKKYEIDYLRDEGLETLHKEFPSTLENWDERNHNQDQILDILLHDNLVKVINLAHELSVETVLPSAYLLYVQITLTEDIVKAIDLGGQKSGGTVTLNPLAAKACLTGRDRLLCRIHTTIIGWLTSKSIMIPGPGCLSAPKCASNRSKTLTSLPALENFAFINALDNVASPPDALICQICRKSLEKVLEDERAELWGDLPSMFGLQKWGDLKDFDV